MKVIGHRGARGLAPENTLAGLRKALEHGADALEFDVRVTKDGVVILHHDPELTDASGAKLPIGSCTYESLLAHKADLVRLEEVLRVIDRKAPLIVEVKPDEPIQPVVEVLQQAKRGHLRLASFSQKTLLALQASLPDIEIIVIERWSGVRASRRLRQLDTRVVFMNQRWLWWGFIRGFKNSGYELYAYTLNDPRKARRWAKYGLAGVVTDYPDRFEQ